MNDLFKCKDCGAPRSYINQYCPICESSGPHIPAGVKITRSRSTKRRVNPEAKWWDDIETDEKPDVKKRKDTRNDHKDIRKYSASDFKSNSKKADDTDIRSSLDTRSSIKPISGKTWGYISLAAVAVIVLVLMSLNIGTLVEQWTGNINQIGKWFAFHPASTTAIALTSPVENKTSTAVNNPTPTSTQAPTTSSGNATINPPQPAKDTTKPVLTYKPVAVPGDTSVTIAWKTDEKATSLVKYGTDASCPFPSSEDSHKDTNHSIYISGLLPDTTYHFQVISSDTAGNTLISNDYTFRTESATNAAPYMGCKAPDIKLRTLDGTEISLGQFRGKKVILNFWASWCTPCKIELPHLQATWEKYSATGDIMILTVAGSQSDENAIRSYVKDNHFTFAVCLDSDDTYFNRYEIVSIPKSYFIDKTGVIRRLQQGMFTSPGEVEFMLNSY